SVARATPTQAPTKLRCLSRRVGRACARALRLPHARRARSAIARDRAALFGAAGRDSRPAHSSRALRADGLAPAADCRGWSEIQLGLAAIGCFAGCIARRPRDRRAAGESTRTDATRPHRAARAPALPCRSNRRPQSASAATAGKLAATALRRSFRSQPARNAAAPRSSKRCDVTHRMRLAYFEDVERIEYQRITFRNVPVRIQEIQDAAPIRTPLRRQVENIGRDALHTVRKIIVLREEVPGAIQRRLRIRE